MKSFNLEIPFSQGSTDKEGNYLIAFSISTTAKDGYGFMMSEKALDSMLAQARGLTINANHQHDLGNVIGPVVDVWLEKKEDITYLWIQARVRNEWVSNIKDLIDSGVRLGGSIECEFVDVNYTKSGNLMVDELRLNGAALTTIPANKATLGTATSVSDGCPGSLCTQLSKTFENMEDDFLIKKDEEKQENESKETLETSSESLLGKWMQTLSDKLETVLTHLETEKTEFKVGKEVELKVDKLDEDKNMNLSELDELKEKYLKLEKDFIGLKAENKSLSKAINGMKEDELVNKALELSKKLDPNTDIVDVVSLKKELESLHPDSGIDHFPVFLKSYNNGLEMALSRLPQGNLPQTNGGISLSRESGPYNEALKKNMDSVNSIGKKCEGD